MQTEKIKRIRSENWLDEDKNLLKELIKERVRIIENKNTDTNTNTLKKKAWVAVHDSFNSMCKGGRRTVAQLKGQWGHIKIAKKKELAENKKSIFKTGGGPPSPLKISQSGDGEDITEWLPNEFVVDTNVYDSDQMVLDNLHIPAATTPVAEEVADNNVKEVADNVVKDNLIETEVLLNPIITLEEEMSHNKENNIIIESQVDKEPKKQGKEKKKEKKKETTIISGHEFAKAKIEEIAEAEISLKKKLYDSKLENEERKKRNLNLEYEVLKAQLEYYKMKKLE